MNEKWNVALTSQCEKQAKRLPSRSYDIFLTLLSNLELTGPIQGTWPNYSKLSRDRHHCHLKKGKPTYVSVWDVESKAAKHIEVVYVGTHEKAPY